MQNPGVPFKPLVLIAALVLIAHLALLAWMPSRVSPDLMPAAVTRPFITRTLPLPETAARAIPHPNPAATPRPARPRRVQSAGAEITAPRSPQEVEKSTSAETDVLTQAEPVAETITANPIADPSPEPNAEASRGPAQTSDPVAAPEAAGTAAPPISLPGSMRLKYDIKGEVSGLGYSASGELLWLHDGKTYDARLLVSHFLLGSRSQSSSGKITTEGLAPKRFGDKVRSEVAAHFERDGEGRGKVIFSANTPSVELQPGAQDQLSIFMQIASLLAGDPSRYPVGSAFEMQAVGGRSADTWRFGVEGEERLSLPGGEQPTLRIKRPAQQVNDITVELWLAPSLGYLPARIRLTQTNGNFVDQQLSSYGPP